MIRYKLIPEDIHKKIAPLAGILSKDTNIIFSYLFGGLLKDKLNPLSDVDVAIYVKNVKKIDYLELFGDIANVLGTDEIDIVILNTAQLSLTGRILQARKVLVDKDPFLRHKYESRVLREFFDFKIKERDILKRRYGIG